VPVPPLFVADSRRSIKEGRVLRLQAGSQALPSASRRALGNGSGEREEEDEEGEKDTAEEHHGAGRGVGRDHKGPRPPHQEAGDAPAMGATRGGQSAGMGRGGGRGPKALSEFGFMMVRPLFEIKCGCAPWKQGLQ